MNVALTPELEAFVNEKIKSGLYPTANEVVREGLRLLRDRDESDRKQLDELRREIAVGTEGADRGDVAPLNAQGMLVGIRGARLRG